MTLDIARTALALLDLTALNDSDSDASISALADQANTPFGPPAALCVFPRFVTVARARLDALGLAAVPVATVTNFPLGGTDIEHAVAETKAAPGLGAAEVDIVFPWRALKAGDAETGARLVAGCRAVLDRSIRLKVIIESGELSDPALIRHASLIAIENGADFVKTSTGKVPINATPEAAEAILQAIHASGKPVGLKVSGGVRSLEDAQTYLTMAERIMGPGWTSPGHFRFGSSSLLTTLLASLAHQTGVAAASGY